MCRCSLLPALFGTALEARANARSCRACGVGRGHATLVPPAIALAAASCHTADRQCETVQHRDSDSAAAKMRGPTRRADGLHRLRMCLAVQDEFTMTTSAQRPARQYHQAKM
eukprot:scaffold7571_cov403-Prasinococcus_capsulatus_cf.AAC.3